MLNGTTTEKAMSGGKAKKGVKKSDAMEVDGRVAGVLLSAVRPELVDNFLTKSGLAVTGEVASRVARLVEHFRAETPKGELGDCKTCGGDSDLRPEVCVLCPYCGAADSEDAPPPEGAAVAQEGGKEGPAKAEAPPVPSGEAKAKKAALTNQLSSQTS